MELHYDFTHKASFEKYSYYGDYWVGLVKFPEYKSIAMKALQPQVMMTTTYLSEQGFSTLVELKTMKRNSLQNLDSLMRGALEKEIEPQFQKLVKEMQEHPSH
ncbi:SCAN domain-containing protein 3-like 5 [Homarus americanus]|uniref:SCAN domain-containing protein 3-like 5 n=1 Tax=Homarus americanus TaxID=6706 RepID=A0A8J5T478_HOMAM|nr:SCAN domain-containing protein 3-like 5 [Homarus americanus]